MVEVLMTPTAAAGLPTPSNSVTPTASVGVLGGAPSGVAKSQGSIKRRLVKDKLAKNEREEVTIQFVF
ncbi:hypothetical protein BGZ73_008593 [Actinomortierella ambigua]|nr:hypothetical protein BGZ73_008593 [Actinomortierella ambigua]